MNTLYFDTETSGLPNDSPDLTKQPHIVQLAAILVDPDGNELHSINTIIAPTDWTIDLGASNVHGITTERAKEVGIPGVIAFGFFSNLCRKASTIVAHNIAFDSTLMSLEFKRLSKDAIHLAPTQFCTMKATTNICKIPGRFPGQYKWPKLEEAHRFFFNEDFDNAHDALADVRACMRIHQHLLSNQ